MKGFLLVVAALAAHLTLTYGQTCVQEDNCKRPDCVCPSVDVPVENPPQLVALTFDDSISDLPVDEMYLPLLDGRTNPDGEPIRATFFIPHSYTSYTAINRLYNLGHEIGDHSISKNPMASYWIEAGVDLLTQEFEGQKTILSTFANMPIDAITSARVPYLAMGGDRTIEAYVASGIKTDNSWPTRSDRRLLPYTLDFTSSQECMVGECPTASFPGFWIAPILNFKSLDGSECNSIYGCTFNATADTIYDWLITEFDKIYTGNRAPIPYMLNSVFLGTGTDSPGFSAFSRFLDHLKTLNDVYLVSMKQVVNWQANPVPASEYSSAQEPVEPAECNARVCALEHTVEGAETEIRYMGSCVTCPEIYPWVGNPLGEKP